VHNPRILFLDEPTLGLDIQTRTSIWEHIRKLRSETNMTIFLTTHYLEEADGLCDRIAIIDHGKIVALDTPTGLKKAVGGDVIEIEVEECNMDVLNLMKSIPGVVLIDGMCTGNKARIKVADANAALPNVLSTFWKNKIVVLNVAVKKPSLDQAFLEYTGRELRDEEQGSAAKPSNGTGRTGRFGRRR
jgi:ABC-2 type transport system ATP-binding protein